MNPNLKCLLNSISFRYDSKNIDACVCILYDNGPQLEQNIYDGNSREEGLSRQHSPRIKRNNILIVFRVTVQWELRGVKIGIN